MHSSTQALKHSSTQALKTSSVFIIGTVLSVSAQASINTQRYQFNPNLTYEVVESSNLYDPYLGFVYPTLLTVGYNYINDPFVVQQTGTQKKLTNVLNYISSYQLGIHHRILNSGLSLGFRTSLNDAHKQYDPESSKTVNEKSTAIGDSYFNLKYRFSESLNWIHSGVVDLGIPTGNQSFYLSEGFSVSAQAVSEYLGQGFRISGNLGYKYAPDAEFQGINDRHKILSALGGFYAINRTSGMTMEFKKDFSLSQSSSQASEIRLGFQKKMISEGWTVFGSVGTGNLPQVLGVSLDNQNGSDYRLSLGIKYTPEFQTPSGIVLKSNQLNFNSNSDYQRLYSNKLTKETEIKNRQDFLNINGKKEISLALQKQRNEQRKILFNPQKMLASQLEYTSRAAIIHESELNNNINSSSELNTNEMQICEFYEKVKVEFPIKVYFDFDQSDIKKTEYPELDRGVRFINQYWNRFDYVKISGHTDSIGTAAYNQILSEKRAKAVQKYLEKKALQKVSYQAIGYGKNQRAIASEKSKSDYAKNRRSEINIEFIMDKKGLICPGEKGYDEFKK